MRHVVLAAVATALLAGCGGAEERRATTAEPAPVSITDDRGKRVALDAPARRVVTLEWDATEDVLALGVQPVGAADTRNYPDWVGAGPRPDGATADVGGRVEPSLERIAALKPDLIVANREGVAKSQAKLERIAPVVVFRPTAAGGSEWKRMVRQFRGLATLLGREDRAREVLEQTEKALADSRARVAEAGVAGDEVAIVQAFTAGKPTANLFDDGALLVEVVRRLGLKNAYDGRRRPFGVTSTSLEGLRKVGDADWMLTLAQATDDPFTSVWRENRAYRRLPVVARGRVRPLGGDTWTWGGPLSIALAAERIAGAVTRRPGEPAE
jgi:iron complex transport system substrate-binding protein